MKRSAKWSPHKERVYRTAMKFWWESGGGQAQTHEHPARVAFFRACVKAHKAAPLIPSGLDNEIA
jgi:hypothetical protein